MYMARAKGRQQPLRWRSNCIRFWRDFRGLKLESAAETLAKPPYGLEYTHTSLGRVENGKQMPTIELIEALAKLYRTDIDSLLNRRPELSDREPAPTAKGLLQLWDKAEEEERGLILDVAKRVVRTGT